VDADIVAVATAAVPYVTAAVSAYGAAVLSRIQETAADATVNTGGRVLRRLLQRNESAPAIEAAVLDLAADPADSDRQVALRLQIRKALAEDDRLAADISRIVNGGATTIISATGERSVAGHTISGVVVTGDDAEITK
jgi:hypothetical protein